MNSRSIPNWLLVVVTLVLTLGTAHAGKKKIVVLDFKGDNAEKFHAEVVKLVKKSHSVIPTDKWNAAADEMGATKINSKNIKKLSAKLKVDGVITGKVDKRRDEYIIKLKLRSGSTGEVLGESVQTSADGPRLSGQAERDIKNELVPRIGDLEANTASGGDDEGEEDKPKKKKGDDDGGEEDKPKKSGFGRKGDDDVSGMSSDDKPKKSKSDDDEDKPKKSKSDDEDKPKKKKFDSEEEAALSTKRDSDEDRPKRKDDDEDRPRKRKADREDGGEESDSVEEEAEEGEPADQAVNLSPAHRAVEAVVGLSFTRRNLSFAYESNLGKVPPGYRQSVPVAGAMVDLTVFPLSFGHKKTDVTANIGLNILYDQVLIINSRKQYLDGQGEAQTANLTTKEKRWRVGPVFRYSFGPGAKAPVVGGSLTFGKQAFTIQQQLPNMESTDIPNVEYTMITPAAFVRFPVTDKIIANLDAGFHAITKTGSIQTSQHYGAATVTGYELELGGDYMVTGNIFARAAIRYQAINFTFKGDPTSMTNTRDTDPEQDVTGAKDVYFGGSVTAGYLF